jgi:hypothetical protein
VIDGLNTAAFGSNVGGTTPLLADVTRLSSALPAGGTTSSDLSGSVFGISVISLKSSAMCANFALRLDASSIKLALRRSCSSMSVRRRVMRLHEKSRQSGFGRYDALRRNTTHSSS